MSSKSTKSSTTIISVLDTCPNEDRLLLNSLVSQIYQPVPGPDYDKLLLSITDQSHKLSFDLAKQIIISLSSPCMWINWNRPIISAAINLISTLLSLFDELSSDICNLFVHFIYYKDKLDYYDKEVLRSVNTMFTELYSTLSRAHPQITTLLVQLLIVKLPNWRKTTFELLYAFHNVIALISSPETSLCLTLNNKCELVSAVCEALIDLELNPDGYEVDNISLTFLKTSVAKITPTSEFIMIRESGYELLSTIPQDNNCSWMKIELISWLILSNLSLILSASTHSTNNEIKLNWDLLCAIFRQIRNFFSQYVLPVEAHLTAFPQICFYLCSLRGGLAINFVEFLWNAVKDEHRDNGSRIISLSYLVSVVTQGSYYLLDLVIELLHDMASWCVDYTYRRRASVLAEHTSLLISQNKVYYAVYDALIYVFVQLHASLLDSKFYCESCERLPIAQINISPFKPLLYLPDDLRCSFLNIISQYNLSWSNISLAQSVIKEHVQTNENNNFVLDLHSIKNLKPSNLFSLPLLCNLSLTSENFIKPLLRVTKLGQKMHKASSKRNLMVNDLKHSDKKLNNQK